MIYLASPYSHPESAVRLKRYIDAFAATVALMRAGRVVYSPIVYSHPLFVVGVGADGSFGEWETLDRTIIGAASMVWVLQLDGWDASRGVKAEVELACGMNKPVRFLTLEEALVGG